MDEMENGCRLPEWPLDLRPCHPATPVAFGFDWGQRRLPVVRVIIGETSDAVKFGWSGAIGIQQTLKVAASDLLEGACHPLIPHSD